MKDGDNGGAYNRLVMVKAPDEEDCPYKENAAELLDFAENNHGFCGRDFVKVLQKLGKDTVAEMLQGVKREVDEKAKEAGKYRRTGAADSGTGADKPACRRASVP